MTVFFLYTGDISAFFSSSGNAEFSMFWLQHSVKVGAIMPEFYLRIITGISPFSVAFLLFKLLISLLATTTLKYLNKNAFGCLKELFIRKILGQVLYFLIAFSTGSVSSITPVSKLSFFSIFNSLTTLLKNSLKVSATFASSFKISRFSWKIILQFVEKLLFESKGLIIFQKVLLSVILCYLMWRDS